MACAPVVSFHRAAAFRAWTQPLCLSPPVGAPRAPLFYRLCVWPLRTSTYASVWTRFHVSPVMPRRGTAASEARNLCTRNFQILQMGPFHIPIGMTARMQGGGSRRVGRLQEPRETGADQGGWWEEAAPGSPSCRSAPELGALSE